MNVPPLASLGVTDLSSGAAERALSNPRLSEREKIGEAAKQFEAVLLRQILGAARKTVIHSGLEEESATADVYRDLVTAHLADSIAQTGEFGFARSLEAQLQRQVGTPPPTPGASASPARPVATATPAGAVPSKSTAAEAAPRPSRTPAELPIAEPPGSAPAEAASPARRSLTPVATRGSWLSHGR